MSKSDSPAMSKSEQDWKSESDHRTMMDAAEIQSDKGRMAGVKQQHRKQTKKLSLVQRTLMAKGR